MKSLLRRTLSLALAAALLVGGLLMPAAASGASEESTQNADHLKALGLFQGTENGYELNNTPDRTQGLVMLIRLLGREQEALSGSYTHPFTDVAASGWEAPYVGYGFESSLTSGVGGGLFGGSQTLAARDYVTFLLRSLGYSDADGDFTWQYALSFAAQIGMMTTDAAIALSSASFNRGDMVDLSYSALTCQMADGSGSLAEKLAAEGVFTTAQGQAEGVIGAGVKVYTYTPYQPPREEGPGVTYSRQSVAGITADVITVDLLNPKVRVEARLVNNKVGATQSFATIAQNSGAKAVVNANFFNSEGDKALIGSLMTNGELMYSMTDYTTLGIRDDGSVTWGRPSMAVWLKGPNTTAKHWFARAVNVDAASYHTTGYSVMYTPAYGTSVTAPCNGYAIEVRNDVVTAYTSYAPGSVITIPADGYVVLLGTAITGLYLYEPPAVGTPITTEVYLFTEDPEGFDPAGVTTMVAGSPCLIKDGVISNAVDANFDLSKFTSGSTPRTAVGTTADGRMILLSTSSATMDQLKQAMLALGCTDAVNLDGGGSCGMYYDGQILHTPGRELTATLQIFVD